MLRLKHHGFILIFALWVLALLTVFAVNLATGVRQKIILARKLDERSRMRYLLESACAQTRIYIRQQMTASGFTYTPAVKTYLHDNPGAFERVELGEDSAAVSFTVYDGSFATERFGVMDEERKLNLNTVSPAVLQRLVGRVLGLRDDEASRLALSLIDWRQPGESQLTGFYSDEYYSNLQYPFAKKSSPYEIPDELLLVQGVSRDVYERIWPYVTIYGGGQVNINTASPIVLYALGLDDPLIEKILAVRSGKDGVDGTGDDHIFYKSFDVATEVNASIALVPQEMRAIDALNLQGLLTTNSNYFSIHMRGSLSSGAGHNTWSKNAWAVYSVQENRILYWKEK